MHILDLWPPIYIIKYISLYNKNKAAAAAKLA